MGASLLKRMDSAVILGLDVWDFSVRSLARPYGRLFLRAVVMRHPWLTMKGLNSYRRKVRPARQPEVAPVEREGRAEPPGVLAAGPVVVGMGFCEKPLEPPCPAGRFNHRCLVLERRDAPGLQAPCDSCHIPSVAGCALRGGAAVYIMTSAEDIARDLLIPSLRSPRGARFILSLCPYSIPPLTLGMAICRGSGWVLPYGKGDCRDFSSWSRADIGIKPERTCLAVGAMKRLLVLLENLRRLRAEAGLAEGWRFEVSGNLYVPAGESSGPQKFMLP